MPVQEDEPQNASSQNGNAAPGESGSVKQPIAKSVVEKERERLMKAAVAKLAEQAASQPTNRLEQEDDQLMPDSARLPFGTEFGSAQVYTVVPAKLAAAPPQDSPRWRIELHGLRRDAGPLGLDIVGDVVLGRGVAGANAPDIDLEPYGGLESGVSRRHALLRPTRNCLYIIDLSSTNGTQHNALHLGAGITRAIQNNDSITLGQLTFTVRIIDGPAGVEQPKEAAKTEATKPVEKADKDKTGPLGRRASAPTHPTPSLPPQPMHRPPTPEEAPGEVTQPMASVTSTGTELPHPVDRLAEPPVKDTGEALGSSAVKETQPTPEESASINSDASGESIPTTALETGGSLEEKPASATPVSVRRRGSTKAVPPEGVRSASQDVSGQETSPASGKEQPANPTPPELPPNDERV